MLIVSMLLNIHPERHRCVVWGGDKAQRILVTFYFFNLKKQKERKKERKKLIGDS